MGFGSLTVAWPRWVFGAPDGDAEASSRRRLRLIHRLALTFGITSLVVGLAAFGAVSVNASGSLVHKERLADTLGGDFSNAALKRLTAEMDPAALHLAQTLDPAIARHDPAPLWAGMNQAHQDTPPAFKLQAVAPDQAVLINDAIPFSSLPNPAARPFVLAAHDPQVHAQAEQCLTAAIYYEAGFESDRGEAAVAQVILNRVRNPLFPKTICGVVFQGSQQQTGCQFTFTCDGSLKREPSPEAWLRAKAVAARALSGAVAPEVGEATHYHANYVAPYWNTALVKLAAIGAHIFYRWNGPLGRPAAFTLPYAGAEGGDWAMASAKMVKVAAPVVITQPGMSAAQFVPVVQTAAPVLVAQPLLASVDIRRVNPPGELVSTDQALPQATLSGRRPMPMIAVPSNW